MYFVHNNKRYELIEVDNDYFTLAKILGSAGNMSLKPKLENMSLSQILDACNCTLETLPSNYQEYLDQRVRQIKTFEVLPLYLDIILLVIPYHDILDLTGFCYQHNLVSTPPSLKEYGLSSPDKEILLLTYNYKSNKLFIINTDVNDDNNILDMLIRC